MPNYVLAQESNRANIPDRLWYAMEETDLADIAANENIATGDKVYVIKQGKTYIFGEDSEWYVSGKSSGGGGTSVDVEPLAVNANGTYTAAEGTAYSPVTVDVPQTTVESLAVAANGTYTAQAGKAYSPVTVSVAAVSKLPQVADKSVTELAAADLEGATSIGYNAFSRCSSLTSVTIPSSVTSIGYNAFSSCSSLTSVTIPSSVTSIGSNAFGSCSSLTSVTIPSGVTSISSSAFSGCSGLASVTIPSSVTSIGYNAFSGCSSLASVAIPSGVTSIESSTFEGCSSLASVTIPSSVTSISSNAFRNCSSLASVTVEATTPPTLSNANAFGNTSINLVIYVPAASVDAYKAATNWSTYADKIQAIPS